MSTPNAAYWHALNLIIPANMWELLGPADLLGGPGELFRKDENQLSQAGLKPSVLARIIAGRKQVRIAENWEQLQDSGIQAFAIGEPGYPKRLGEIPCPPPIIYIRGDAKALVVPGLAVVGTRKMSSYGQAAVEHFVPPLVHMGAAIISGMAMGVDAAALEQCLECGGVPIAVVATSLEWAEVGPKSNYWLAKKIEQAGCLVSETPPGKPSIKISFPQRNRIVSGLSLGVLVIEAALHSGSLITANLAVEQNRELFAVPGSIFSGASAGTLDVIKRGATCATSAADIASGLGWDQPGGQMAIKLSDPLHQEIARALESSPMGPQEISKMLGRTPAMVMGALTEMELAGAIKRLPDGIYVKIR